MRIGIEGLRLQCRVGVEAAEREQPQEILVDVRVDIAAIQSDALADTLDYCELDRAFKAHVREREFCLIERLATDLLSIVTQFSQVRSAQLRVSKPNALVDADCAYCEVEQTCGLI